MNIAVSELNEIALVVSNFFKNHKPNTMFWSFRASTATTNFNREEALPFKTIARPFGVQAVLESFAKSLGFKSYNGLLASKISYVQLLPSALQSLNPNPLNAYFTEVWEVLTESLMQQILSGQSFPSKVVRNFKHSKFADYSPFVGRNMLSLIKRHFVGEKLAVEIAHDELTHVFSMASSMYHYAFEQHIKNEGYERLFENSRNLDDQYEIESGVTIDDVALKFKDFLVREEFDYPEPQKFISLIIRALKHYFDVNVSFRGVDKPLLEKKVIFQFRNSDVKQYFLAKFDFDTYINYQKAAFLLVDKYKNDGRFYDCVGRIGEHLELQYSVANLREEDFLYDGFFDASNFGTKAYWINMCSAYMFENVTDYTHSWEHPKFHDLKDYFGSVEQAIDTIEQFLETKLDELRIEKLVQHGIRDRNYSQKYKIIHHDPLAVDLNLPKYVNVVSERPLRYLVGESSVFALLADQAMIDLDNVGIGQADVLKDREETIAWIRPTKSLIPANFDVQFNPLQIIHALNLLYATHPSELADPLKQGQVKSLFLETEDSIQCAMTMALVNTLYRQRETSFHTDGCTEIALRVSICKKTKRLKVIYDQSFLPQEFGIHDGYSECLFTQDIVDELVQFELVGELIYKYVMKLHQEMKQNEISNTNTRFEMGYYIRPSNALEDGLSVDALVDTRIAF